MTDIISKVSNDDTSLVEVAYELLVLSPRSGGSVDDITDFVDQCQVISTRLIAKAAEGSGDDFFSTEDDDDDDDDEDDDEEDEIPSRRSSFMKKNK